MFRVVEEFRREALNRVFKAKKFAQCWPTWRAEILARTDNFQSGEGIFLLGEQLREIFATTAKKTSPGEKKAGRDQDELSGGGAAWEGLVCWYMNTVLTGTRAAVAKHSKSLVPTPILDAVSINYMNKPTNSESDLIGLTFPSNIDGEVEKLSHRALSEFCGNNMGKMGAFVIQCKTNWNDNAQIPMLWDLVYKAEGFNSTGLTVGWNGRDIKDLAKFRYCFVTMPSQKGEFKKDSMPVRRVSALSGSNYWGRPSESGIAWSVSEVFKRVFGSEVIGDVREHVKKSVQNGHLLLR